MPRTSAIAAALVALLCGKPVFAALPTVSLTSPSADTVEITLSGTAGQWFAVGFGATRMSSQPYTVVIDGSGTATERKLGGRSSGSSLSSSVTTVSSVSSGGTRTVVLSRALAGASGDHYTFATGSISIIRATGSGSSIAYHSQRGSSSVSLAAPPAPPPTPTPAPPPTPPPTTITTTTTTTTTATTTTTTTTTSSAAPAITSAAATAAASTVTTVAGEAAASAAPGAATMPAAASTQPASSPQPTPTSAPDPSPTPSPNQSPTSTPQPTPAPAPQVEVQVSSSDPSPTPTPAPIQSPTPAPTSPPVVSGMSGSSTPSPTPVPQAVVQVSMGLTVAEPQAFVDDPASKAAVEAGLAASAGVDASAVNAVLTVGSRRLAARGRMLQEGTVNVDATIEVADEDAAATLETTVAEIEPGAMASSLSTALTEAGVASGVTVTALTATATTLSAAADDADAQGSPQLHTSSSASPASAQCRTSTVLTVALIAAVSA